MADFVGGGWERARAAATTRKRPGVQSRSGLGVLARVLVRLMPGPASCPSNAGMAVGGGASEAASRGYNQVPVQGAGAASQGPGAWPTGMWSCCSLLSAGVSNSSASDYS
jgi:hypothetical protein